MEMMYSGMITLCILEDVYRRFRYTRCLHHQGDVFALMVNLYKDKQR